MSVTMSAVYDQTCHVCEKIKKYLLHYHYNSQRNRQLSANREIYIEYICVWIEIKIGTLQE